MKTFFIVAGESSGDVHGAKLMLSLQKQYPGCQFKGIGGPHMQNAGLESMASLRDIAVVGFYEVAKKYGMFRALMKSCQTALLTCDAFIAVDYPGFNMRLATFAKGKGIPVMYYIAPQLWAWGKKRAAKLAAAIDHLFVVFPFEVEFFSQFGIATTFVGHPLLDEPQLQEVPQPVAERERILALLPGSRQQEISRHVDPMLSAAQQFLQSTDESWRVCMAVPEHLEVARHNLQDTGIDVYSSARELMLKAKVGLVKTGTSNLEAALCGMPFAMMYKTSALSYHIARRLISLEHISLVNILLHKTVVPELIQQEARPHQMAASLATIASPEVGLAQQESFLEIRDLLGGKGASDVAAASIAKVLRGM